jgi:hypothetical protein
MKVGILMSDFSCSQLSFYVIRNVNEACNTSPKNDYIGFFENLSGNVIEPSFCLMNMSEVWGFEGFLVATSASTALTLIKAVTPSKKYFYVWDLEWIRNPHNYHTLLAIYRHPSINLIARSETHAKAIENFCNKRVVGVMDDFNLSDLGDIING